MSDNLRDIVLEAIEASLDSQLRAVRRLRRGTPTKKEGKSPKRLSQVDMAYDILKKAGAPLHITEILERIRKAFGVSVDRESLVSSLTKKVARQDRFLRAEKNTFGLRKEPS